MHFLGSAQLQFARYFCLALLCFSAGIDLGAQPSQPPHASANQNPKAACTVNLVYDAGQSDIYYIEMRIDETADNSSFMPCGWENGYFGLQQYNGEDKRAFNFSVWNGALDPADATTVPDTRVEVLYSDPKTIVKPIAGKGGGMQCMREFHWQVGENIRFAMQAQLQTNKTAYTAWLFDPAAKKWERIATFRAINGRWLRGFYSFIEDFHRDFESAKQTRRARFGNIWYHQDRGTYNPIRRAMFTISALGVEARSAVNAGEFEGGFFLATGGNVHKTQKVGGSIVLTPEVPFRAPEAPSDLFFLYDPPKL